MGSSRICAEIWKSIPYYLVHKILLKKQIKYLRNNSRLVVDCLIYNFCYIWQHFNNHKHIVYLSFVENMLRYLMKTPLLFNLISKLYSFSLRVYIVKLEWKPMYKYFRNKLRPVKKFYVQSYCIKYIFSFEYIINFTNIKSFMNVWNIYRINA